MKSPAFYQTAQTSVPTNSVPSPRGVPALLAPPTAPEATPNPGSAMCYANPNPKEKFAMHAAEWKKGTRFISSTTRIVEHPAYQAIIAMGKDAIPFILDELRKEPRFWFPALQRITGANPTPPEMAGKVMQMAKAWLAWGEANGY